MNKSNEEYIKDAIRFYWVGRYQEALEAFEQAIQIDPNCVKALHGRGVILAQMNEYEKALEAFEQALKLAPDIVKIHEDMAKIYGKMAMEIFYLHKDYQKSRLLYKKAAELDKRFEAAYLQRKWQLLDRAYALFNRCRCHTEFCVTVHSRNGYHTEFCVMVHSRKVRKLGLD